MRAAVVRHVHRVRLIRGLLGVVLPLRVEGGDDLQPTLEQGALPRLLALAQGVERSVRVVQDLADHVAHEEGLVPLGDAFAGAVGQLQRLLLRVQTQGALDPHGVVVFAQGDHPVEHVVAPDLRSDGVQDRVVEGGPPDHAGQRGALGQRQLRRGLLEVELGRRADPVHAVAQVDLVQIQLEDLVLRVLLLGADRQGQLLELPLEAPIQWIEPQGVLHQLLGDRGATLDHFPRPRVLDDGAQQ